MFFGSSNIVRQRLFYHLYENVCNPIYSKIDLFQHKCGVFVVYEEDL